MTIGREDCVFLKGFLISSYRRTFYFLSFPTGDSESQTITGASFLLEVAIITIIIIIIIIRFNLVSMVTDIIVGVTIIANNRYYTLLLLLGEFWYLCWLVAFARVLNQYLFLVDLLYPNPTAIEGNPKAPLSIARCREGHYTIPWIAPIYSWSIPYNSEC